MIPDDRPFVEGSRVRVLADDNPIEPVPIGTIATVMDSENSHACTKIVFRRAGKDVTTWLWNTELQLVDGARKAHS